MEPAREVGAGHEGMRSGVIGGSLVAPFYCLGAVVVLA